MTSVTKWGASFCVAVYKLGNVPGLKTVGKNRRILRNPALRNPVFEGDNPVLWILPILAVKST